MPLSTATPTTASRPGSTTSAASSASRRAGSPSCRCGATAEKSYHRDWDQVPNSRRDLKALNEILSGFPDRGKETSGIEVVQLEHQASRRRFWLFRNPDV